jgi:hypothetical protein
VLDINAPIILTAPVVPLRSLRPDFARRLTPDGFKRPEIQPVVGFDVSSSGVSILAVLLGHRETEERLRHASIKQVAADWAVQANGDPGHAFKLPEGATYEGVKQAAGSAITTLCYGAAMENIARATGGALGTTANVGLLLAGVEGVSAIKGEWLPTAKAVARAACRRDPCAGVTLTDPFDGSVIRWNEVKLEDRYITSDGLRIYYRPPAGEPDEAGDYPVDASAPGRRVPPGIVHVLDAAFLGFVVEALARRGVRNVACIHDCVLVAQDDGPALEEAILEAGEPWYRSLESVYDDLLRYLEGTKHEPKVRGWKATWQARVTKGDDWPKFRVTEELLVEDARQGKGS